MVLNRCIAEGCYRSAKFGVSGTGIRTHCPLHTVEGMLHVRAAHCIVCGCHATRALVGSIDRIYCAKCVPDGIETVCMTVRRCEMPGCTKHGVGRGKRFCTRHARLALPTATLASFASQAPLTTTGCIMPALPTFTSAMFASAPATFAPATFAPAAPTMPATYPSLRFLHQLLPDHSIAEIHSIYSQRVN